MALGNLISGIASKANKAYEAYKKAEEYRNNRPTQAIQPTQAPISSPAQNPSKEHQAYINANFGGGMGGYIKLQQDRYNDAFASNDNDMMDRLAKDAYRVGFNLTKPQAIQQQVYQNPFEESMNLINSKYENLNNEYRKANELAVKQGVDRLNSQKSTINQGFDNNAKQAYIASMQARNKMPQELAVQGINGGATETAMLGLDTAYQNNMNNIMNQRQNALTGIDNEILDLQNQGNLNTAEQTMQNNQAAISAYQNALNNSANYKQWLAEYNANRNDTQHNQNYQDKVFDYNKNKDMDDTTYARKQNEYENILNRLSMGLISPNDAVALGVPAQDVQSFVNRLIAAQNADIANTIANTNKKNSSGSKEKAPTTPLTTADKYLSQGNREKAIEVLSSIYSSDQIKKYLADRGYITDDIDWGVPITADSIISSNGRNYENPVLSTIFNAGNIIDYYKKKGYTSEQIASILNK